MSNEPKLSEREKRVYEALSYNEDTLIVDLYAQWQPGVPAPNFRGQQQRVGKYVSRLNTKLVGSVIRPGFARYSYRLYFAK